jgi:hypothetical protein
MKYKYDLADEVPSVLSIVCPNLQKVMWPELHFQADFAKFNVASGVEGDTVNVDDSLFEQKNNGTRFGLLAEHIVSVFIFVFLE